MDNKYYIESGSFRDTQLAIFAKSAILTSFKRFINMSLAGRLSDMIMISQRGFSLDLFDSSQTSYLTKEEVIQRQQNYIIILNVDDLEKDPPEDIIFLPTKNVLNYLGYGKLYEETVFSINTDELRVL